MLLFGLPVKNNKHPTLNGGEEGGVWVVLLSKVSLSSAMSEQCRSGKSCRKHFNPPPQKKKKKKEKKRKEILQLVDFHAPIP